MKTVSYGVMHFCVAFCVTYVLTGSLAVAGSIALIEPLVQTVAYTLHERAWDLKLKKKQIPDVGNQLPVV